MNNIHDKLSLWQERFQEQQSSGLTVRNWCREQQVPQSQFFYWRRKIHTGTQEPPQFAEISFS